MSETGGVMSKWKKAELERQKELAAKSKRLMRYLRATKKLYPDENLTMVVDNDCWHLQVGADTSLSEGEWENIYETLSDLKHDAGGLDCGPQTLSMLLAIGHGFSATRP